MAQELLEEQGLPAARSTQRRASSAWAMKYAPARISASCGRSGPRVTSGLRPVRERQASSSGSPSTREVITSTAGCSAAVSHRQMVQRRPVCPVNILDDQQQRPFGTRPGNQLGYGLRVPRARVELSMAS